MVEEGHFQDAADPKPPAIRKLICGLAELPGVVSGLRPQLNSIVLLSSGLCWSRRLLSCWHLLSCWCLLSYWCLKSCWCLFSCNDYLTFSHLKDLGRCSCLCRHLGEVPWLLRSGFLRRLRADD